MTAVLDYFGVRPECGCISAWCSATYSSPADIKQFYVSMAATGREVRRMEFTEELRQKLDRCPHDVPRTCVPDGGDRMSEQSMGVKAKLHVVGPQEAVGEPATVTVRVEPGPRVTLDLESGTQWTLDFDPASAAYVAGHLAMRAGVVSDAAEGGKERRG